MKKIISFFSPINFPFNTFFDCIITTPTNSPGGYKAANNNNNNNGENHQVETGVIVGVAFLVVIVAAISGYFIYKKMRNH